MKYLIMKIEDIKKYLSEEEISRLIEFTSKITQGREMEGKKATNEYYLVNKDEDYSEKIIKIILEEEEKKSVDNN